MFKDLVKIPLSTLMSYFILLIFALSPFVGFLTRNLLDVYFNYAMTILCAFGVLLFFLDDFKLKIPLYLGYLIAFTAYTIISDILIVDASIDAKYFYSNRLLGTICILIIVENTHITKRFFNTLFITNHSILLIAFIVIIIQQLINNLFFVDPVFHQALSARAYSNTRLPSIYSWIGSAGILGLSFLPVLGCQIAHHLKNNMKGVFYLYTIGAIVAFISKSRFIMLNFLLLLLLLPIYRGFNINAALKYTIIGLFFILISYQGAKMAGVDVERIISERILEENRGGLLSGSAGTRILAFEIFAKLYTQNPILGKGKFHRMGDASEDEELVRMLRGRSSQIHVGYLSLLYYYGIVGGVLFILFLFQISKETYRLGRKTLYWGPFFAILQFLLTNLTGVYFHMLLMGMILSLVYSKYYSQELAETETNDEQLAL